MRHLHAPGRLRTLCSVGLALLAAAPSAQSARYTLRLDIDGVERKVLVHAPDVIDAHTPLLLAFHGRGDDAAPFARAVRLHEDWPEALVAYPKGEMTDTTPPMRGWQYRAQTYGDRDLKLVDALLARLRERHAIPPERSYAAGFSNGGHFVFLLYRERNPQFAAYAALGALQPDYAQDAPRKPFLYLFGRREDPAYQADWARTVDALSRHQRGAGPLEEFAGCCRLQRAGPDGAPFAFGVYNAGHIWPRGGNHWIRRFFEEHAAAPADRVQ